MALTQRLQMRQSQALVMTPQLMQAIKLLQLSNLDLAAYVEGELEKNPLLERAAEGEPGVVDGNAEPVAAEFSGDRDTGEIGVVADRIDESLETSRSAIEERLGTDLENEFPDEASAGPRSGADVPARSTDWSGTTSGGHENSDYNLEAFVSATPTLADHLAEQLSMAVTDPVRRMIGQYLIDMVDEAGYLTGDLVSVAEKLGAPMAEVEAVLGVVQGFDPPGVCARNLTECLAIQLKERNRFDPAMAALVGRLDLLAKRDLASLRRICGVGDEDLAEMIVEIRNLNPKPGLAFGSTMVQPIVPDVYVRSGPDGGFIVELNSDTLPKILVNQRYHAELSKNARADSAKSYLAENLQSATWLMRLLCAWRAASAPAQPQDHRRRHQHARVDGFARHRQQIHRNQPRHLRIEVFLHLVDRVVRRRRRPFRGSRAGSHQASDRGRKRPRRVVGRHHCRAAA
jgi:RNA polymerase sigma-54 factor